MFPDRVVGTLAVPKCLRHGACLGGVDIEQCNYSHGYADDAFYNRSVIHNVQLRQVNN